MEMFHGNDLSDYNLDNHCALLYMLTDLVESGHRTEEVVEFINAHIRSYFEANNNFGRAVADRMNKKYGESVKPLKFQIANDAVYEKFISRTFP